MKEKIGSFLLVIGVLGIMYFGYQYVEGPELFKEIGIYIRINPNDYGPMVFSGLIALAGVVVSKINVK